MQDRQLYQQILGITSPWQVERVELALEEGEVRVFLEHDPQTAERQEHLNESVPSISSRIRIRTARTVRPGMTLIRYVAKRGFASGSFASYRRILNVYALALINTFSPSADTG